LDVAYGRAARHVQEADEREAEDEHEQRPTTDSPRNGDELILPRRPASADGA
jgi:hypothetical protein